MRNNIENNNRENVRLKFLVSLLFVLLFNYGFAQITSGHVDPETDTEKIVLILSP